MKKNNDMADIGTVHTLSPSVRTRPSRIAIRFILSYIFLLIRLSFVGSPWDDDCTISAERVLFFSFVCFGCCVSPSLCV